MAFDVAAWSVKKLTKSSKRERRAVPPSVGTPLGGARPRARSAAMYDEPDVRYGVKRESQAKNVLLCKTELGKVRIERRDWWLISPVTTTPATVTTPNRRRPVLSPPSFAS